MKNELKELYEDAKMIIKETLDDEWRTQLDVTDFTIHRDYEAYGDTYVSTGDYISDEDDTKFREGFIQDHDADVVIDLLRANPDFRKCMVDLVKEYAYNADLCA